MIDFPVYQDDSLWQLNIVMFTGPCRTNWKTPHHYLRCEIHCSAVESGSSQLWVKSQLSTDTYVAMYQWMGIISIDLYTYCTDFINYMVVYHLFFLYVFIIYIYICIYICIHIQIHVFFCKP